jgi:hypothetical protein
LAHDELQAAFDRDEISQTFIETGPGKWVRLAGG